nr:hypothetical protein [Tanacetum cinerariifolium]
MAETMKQYMSKTRADYGSGVARPKIEDKDNFELKGQFLKELCNNTFNGSNHEDANEHIEKVVELVDLFHILNITIDQEVILFYNGLGIPTRQIFDSRVAIPSKTTADAKVAIRKMVEYSQKWHNGTSRSRRASIKTLEIQIKQMSKVLQERGFGSLPSSTEANMRDQVKSISTTIEADSCPIRHIGSFRYAVSTGQNPYSEASHINNSIPRKEKDPWSFTLPYFIINVCFDNAFVDLGASVIVMPLLTYLNLGLDFIILDMPEDIKVPLILERSFLSIARAKIDVYKRKITLRVKEERIIFTSIKTASSLIKRVYKLSLRERIELDLEARLMGETLVINRSLDPFFEDYIEQNDLNEPFELRRNQDDDLMPTIKEIHIDCAHNIKFSCMIGFEFTHVNFFLLLYVNVMSKKFHNSIMKDKMGYKGNNVIGALMNVPIFVGTFSVVTDFVVLENMDAYRDEGMGDVIFGEPFLREVGVKTRHFKWIITIYNGDDQVTYKMMRSHPRFKHHTNEQCNKIPTLLKVSEEDKMKGISHPYQKLKGFYKGVLNLGPDYIRDAKMEEWLTNRTLACMRWNVIMEYMVNISKRRALWNLNEDILKITILTINTPYPSRKIWRIRASTHQRAQRKKDQYAVSSEDQYAILEV